MRKNAAGLASICILSTMVLVTLAQRSHCKQGQQIYWRKAIQQIIQQRHSSKTPLRLTNLQNKLVRSRRNRRAPLPMKWTTLACFVLQKSMEGGVDIEGGYIREIAQLRSLLSFLRMITIVFFGTNFQLGDNEAVLGLVKGDDKRFRLSAWTDNWHFKSKRWWNWRL